VEVPDGKLYLWEADWLPDWDTRGETSGRIVGRAIGFGASRGGVMVACAEGAVLVRRVQLDGQGEADAIDLGFLREGTQL
jgi:formyl transferase-like protein